MVHHQVPAVTAVRSSVTDLRAAIVEAASCMRQPLVRFWRALAPLALFGLTACPDNPTVQGPTTVAQPPQISCPAPPPQPSPLGQPVAVSYLPTVQFGAEPVTTSCSPVSGSPFPVGTTPVTCTATDVQRRTSTCTFNVVVQQPPRISATRFVAFGDSITWGEDGALTLTATLREFLGLGHQPLRLTGREYPTVLQQSLASRYTSQTPTVANQGVPGEKAADATTLARFSAIAGSGQFEAVLLMEGTNDIYGGTGGNPPGIAPAIANLRRMIIDARSRNVRVFLATVPPQNPNGPRGALGYQTVPLLNAEIRLLANAEGVPLVDVFDAFSGNLTLLGPDGLHPNTEGYATIANRFFTVLRERLEAASTLSGAPSLARPLF